MMSRARELGRQLVAACRSPLGALLAAALLLRWAGLGWGLPASDGWDDDGIAPRDFLVGVAMTYWPGHHATYPPLQLLALALLSAPVWLVQALRAPSLSPDVLVATFIQVPTMTALAVIARATTIAMSLGVLWNAGKIGEALGGSRRAGLWVAGACTCNAVFTYYSQTTNLEVPYLFWSVLALRELVSSMVAADVRKLRRVPLFAALAVATKDQAYALFLLGVPVALLVWVGLDAQARRQGKGMARELALGTAAGLALLLVVDGAVTNPSGFADRIHMLLGGASQDHAFYGKSLMGRSRALVDSLRIFPEFYTWAFAPWAVVGVCLAAFGPHSRREPGLRAARLAPLWLALSFTVAFDMAARRSEHRFVLPQMLMWGIYAGLACDAALPQRAAGPAPGAPWGTARAWTARLVVTACWACAIFRCMAVEAAMVFDPRYDTERWLAEHVVAGERVEVYGNNVHLPRFPAAARVARVEPTPTGGRNPIPGVTEVDDRFPNVEARDPRFIVVSEFWAYRYLMDPGTSTAQGRVLTPEQSALQGDVESRRYFHALVDGTLGYRLAHVSAWASTVWPRIDIHASLTRSMWIFEKSGSAAQ